MKNITVSQEDIVKLKTLKAQLKKAASKLWNQNESGIYTVNIKPADDIDLKKYLEDSGWKNNELLSEFTQSCSESNITSFQNYCHGSSAKAVIFCKTLEGQQLVARFGSSIALEKRAICPLVVQPHKIWEGGQEAIEIMPLLPMVVFTANAYRSPISSRQKRKAGIVHENSYLLGHYIKELGFDYSEYSSFDRDVAVFPNGLLVQVDPGELGVGSNRSFKKTQFAIQKIFERVKDMEVFEYFDENGNWPQDKYFANPFPNEPAKPRPAI